MAGLHELTSYPGDRSVFIPDNRIFRHVLTRDIDAVNRFDKIPADCNPPPIFQSSYFANIGTEIDPILLDLRIEPISKLTSDFSTSLDTPPDLDNNVRIALLMTNERRVEDLLTMGKMLYRKACENKISFDAVIGPESLGSKLAFEIARTALIDFQRDIFPTSFQKGKSKEVDGHVVVGSPKFWIPEEAGVDVFSITSTPGTTQRLYLDPKIAGFLQNKSVLIVDDVKSTGGTLDASLKLCEKFGLNVTGVVTVFTEGGQIESDFNGIPFDSLGQLPFFQPIYENGEIIGYQPIPGTSDGLRSYYAQRDRYR